MAINIHDYLFEQSGIDWSQTLAEWSRLVPAEFTLWLVTRFADLFLVPSDGTVQMLDVGVGTLKKVAESRDDFCNQVDDFDHAKQWFMIPLVDRLVSAGVTLGPQQCYGFKIPPVLGGQYDLDNIAPISITDYLGAYGSIHTQLIDVPDGAQIQLKVTE